MVGMRETPRGRRAFLHDDAAAPCRFLSFERQPPAKLRTRSAPSRRSRAVGREIEQVHGFSNPGGVTCGPSARRSTRVGNQFAGLEVRAAVEGHVLEHVRAPRWSSGFRRASPSSPPSQRTRLAGRAFLRTYTSARWAACGPDGRVERDGVRAHAARRWHERACDECRPSAARFQSGGIGR